ncbi:MAG: hypothetical protein PUG60_16390 [Lachnospiraceae bacterium]|nr:hypothetical protein [Lachnospiraceae bacterium]
MSVTDEIYSMILDNLHITYTPDESTSRRIRNETAAGIAYIRKYCSPDADCRPGTEYGQMLCDYVLRAESGALETFAGDYARDITSGRIKADVDEYAEAMGYDA